jgi:hypothetical protein
MSDKTKSAYFLLDRSGSMAGRMDAAAKTVNDTVKGLPGDVLCTVITFDAGAANVFTDTAKNSFDIVRDKVPAGMFAPVEDKEFPARGGTPLFDAIGHLVNLINQDKSERGTVVIFTDGAENMSKTYTRETAKTALDGVEARGWKVDQLGMDYDVYTDAQGLGRSYRNTVNVTSATMRSGVVGQSISASSTAYYQTGTDRGFSDSVKFGMGDRTVKPDPIPNPTPSQAAQQTQGESE